MAEPRGRGESAICFEHQPGMVHKPGTTKDSDNSLHRGCTGRWHLQDLKDEMAQGVPLRRAARVAAGALPYCTAARCSPEIMPFQAAVSGSTLFRNR
jgi:hypothetical protein